MNFLTLSKLLNLFKRLNLSSLPATDPGSGQPWLHGSGSIVVGAFTGGSGSWGGITGTLADQSDLQSALNAKLPIAGGVINGGLEVAQDLYVSGGIATETITIDGQDLEDLLIAMAVAL